MPDDSPKLLKEPSPIRTYRSHLAPHRWGECRANGPMCVVLASRQSPKMSGMYDYTVRFFYYPSTLGLREKDQSCHHEVWMHLALANPRGDHAPQYKHDQRLHLEEELRRTNKATIRTVTGHPFDARTKTCTPRSSLND